MPFRQRLLARSDLQLWFLICWACACFQSEDSFRLDAVFNMLSGPADFGDTAEFQEFEKSIPKWTFGYRLANVLETGHIAAIALIQTCRLVNESNGLDVPPASRSCVHSTSKQKILTEYKYACSVLRLWDPLHNPLRSVISRTRTVCCVVFLANSRAIGKKRHLSVPGPYLSFKRWTWLTATTATPIQPSAQPHDMPRFFNRQLTSPPQL